MQRLSRIPLNVIAPIFFSYLITLFFWSLAYFIYSWTKLWQSLILVIWFALGISSLFLLVLFSALNVSPRMKDECLLFFSNFNVSIKSILSCLIFGNIECITWLFWMTLRLCSCWETFLVGEMFKLCSDFDGFFLFDLNLDPCSILWYCFSIIYIDFIII